MEDHGSPGSLARMTFFPRQCGTLSEVGPNENLTERSLQDAQRLFLMSEAVQPVTPEPCVTQDSVRFSHLVVDLVQAKDTLYHVLYIGTGEPAPPNLSSEWEEFEGRGWLRGSGPFKATPSGPSRVGDHPEGTVHDEPQPPWLLLGRAARAAPGAPRAPAQPAHPAQRSRALRGAE